LSEKKFVSRSGDGQTDDICSPKVKWGLSGGRRPIRTLSALLNASVQRRRTP